jgi:IS4 transposase
MPSQSPYFSSLISRRRLSQASLAQRGNIIEITGEFTIPKSRDIFQARIIGFWSTDDHSYHWYATNLKVASILIYPLYRLRWTLELVWKSWKSIFHLDEITSTDRNIILNLALAGMCAGLLAICISSRFRKGTAGICLT